MTWLSAKTHSLPAARSPRRRRDQGLTILEVMIVLVILSMAGVVVGIQVTQQFDRAKVDLAHLQLRQVQNALLLFQLDVRRYPTAEEGIAALVETPDGIDTWRGPYLRSRELLADPWGQPLGYSSEGDHFTVVSLGADRRTGGDGIASDIRLADVE
jgi:general secretion pathway protein G